MLTPGNKMNAAMVLFAMGLPVVLAGVGETAAQHKAFWAPDASDVLGILAIAMMTAIAAGATHMMCATSQTAAHCFHCRRRWHRWWWCACAVTSAGDGLQHEGSHPTELLHHHGVRHVAFVLGSNLISAPFSLMFSHMGECLSVSGSSASVHRDIRSTNHASAAGEPSFT